MDDPSDRTAFLADDPVRIAVARACLGNARTKAQIAKELARDPGSLSAIATLEGRGALDEAGHGPARGKRPGGKRWKLNDAWREALAAAEAQADLGAMPDGVDLVLVPAAETTRACETLATGQASVAWGVSLRGEQMGLLLCPSTLPNHDAAALQLLAELAANDVRAIRLHVHSVMPSHELREWAQSIVSGGPSALPSPRG